MWNTCEICWITIGNLLKTLRANIYPFLPLHSYFLYIFLYYSLSFLIDLWDEWRWGKEEDIEVMKRDFPQSTHDSSGSAVRFIRVATALIQRAIWRILASSQVLHTSFGSISTREGAIREWTAYRKAVGNLLYTYLWSLINIPMKSRYQKAPKGKCHSNNRTEFHLNHRFHHIFMQHWSLKWKRRWKLMVRMDSWYTSHTVMAVLSNRDIARI